MDLSSMNFYEGERANQETTLKGNGFQSICKTLKNLPNYNPILSNFIIRTLLVIDFMIKTRHFEESTQ